MKKSILTVTVFLFTLSSGFSQNSTFIGGEFALTGDIYDFNDPCGLITTTPLITGSWGITVGREINRNFLVETGLIRKYYDSGFGYNNMSFAAGSSSNAFNSWQIPLRLKAKLNLIKNRFFLTTTIGYHFSINSDYGYGGGVGGDGFISGSDTVIVSYTVNDSLAKTFSLLETGIGFEFAVTDGFIISLSSSYYTGFNKVYQMDMTTEGGGCSPDNAFGISKGSYWAVSLGIKYAISNFWNRKQPGN
jgi:hypothetical protein